MEAVKILSVEDQTIIAHAVRANDPSLGLSICYELASSLGGEITITSEPVTSTTFAVWQPGLMEEHER